MKLSPGLYFCSYNDANILLLQPLCFRHTALIITEMDFNG